MGNLKDVKEAPAKKSRLRKVLFVVGIVLVVLWVLFLAAAFFAPKVARNYVEAHAKEWVGRRVEIGTISFNPFRFSVSLKDFTLFESDDTTRFVAFKEFLVNLDPTCLLKGDICLSEVKLDAPYARIEKNGELFNFSDILETVAPADSSAKADSLTLTDSSAAKVSPSADSSTVAGLALDFAKTSARDSSASPAAALPFGISIRHFSILSGNVVFDDKSVNSHIDIRDFSVQVPEVYFSNQNTSAGVHLDFAGGGSLSVDADYNMQQGDFNVHVALDKFSIATVKPYLESSLNFKDLAGFVSVDLKASGNTANVLASSAAGTVSVDSVVLTETSGKTFEVSHVGVGIAGANLEENRFAFDSVSVNGAALHFDLNKNSNNLTVLLSPKPVERAAGDSAHAEIQTAAVDSLEKALPQNLDPADSVKEKAVKGETVKDSTAAESPQKLAISLGKLSVSDVKFTLNDNTIPGHFSYAVTGISVNASDVSLDKATNIGVSAALPHGGSFKLSANANPADLNSLKANISVKNVDMRDFSKYAEHYTGYPLTAGRLAFASDNVLKNAEIDSRNTIDIYDLTVGDKPDNADPEFNVPMKVALYILKDKDGKIAFDVPVKGNINDPEFSYGKIVWQTVMNLMIKVALSPAKLLLGSSTPSEFSMDIAADDFTSEQYDLAKKWTEVLNSKPGSSLTLVQAYQPKRQLNALANALKKLDYYKVSTGKASLSPVDRKAALEAEEDAAFEEFSKTWTRPSDAELSETLRTLALARNEKLLKFLKAQPGVTDKNLKVRLANASERASAGKKVLFRMMVELP